MRSAAGKRVLDLAVAVPLGLLTLPLLLALGVAVRLSSRGPAIFWSTRVGRDGRLFRMPKLRSMFVEAPELPTAELAHPARHITPLGRFLRRSSLDELPQLWCVIVGEMSLVGPRPAMSSQTQLLSRRRASGAARLRPGMTGLAQVSGRDELRDDAKAMLDAEYCQRQSMRLDLSILLRTGWAVMSSRGVSH